MYLSPVPVLDDIFTEDFNGNLIFTKNINEIKAPLANFYPSESRSNIRIFVNHVRDVLLFRDIVSVLRPVCSFRYFGRYVQFRAWLSSFINPFFLSLHLLLDSSIARFLFRLGDVFMNWIFYLIQIAFPFYLIITFGEVVYNIM